MRRGGGEKVGEAIENPTVCSLSLDLYSAHSQALMASATGGRLCCQVSEGSSPLLDIAHIFIPQFS